MDIWLAAVLVAWLPVATALALLVGHSLREAGLSDGRLLDRRLQRRGRRGAEGVDLAVVVLPGMPAQGQERVPS